MAHFKKIFWRAAGPIHIYFRQIRGLFPNSGLGHLNIEKANLKIKIFLIHFL